MVLLISFLVNLCITGFLLLVVVDVCVAVIFGAFGDYYDFLHIPDPLLVLGHVHVLLIHHTVILIYVDCIK